MCNENRPDPPEQSASTQIAGPLELQSPTRRCLAPPSDLPGAGIRRIGSAAVTFLMVATSVSAQQVRARIVDHVSRQPIVGVHVRVVDDANVEIAAETGADGFFAIERIEPGSYTLLIEHPGYAPVRQSLVIAAEGAVTVPAIVLKSTAITLDTLSVEARARDHREDLRGADLTHVISGARMARLEQANVSGPGVIRQLGAALRVRQKVYESVCVESTRRYMTMRDFMTGGLSDGCNMVVVVLDGTIIGDGSQLLAGMQVGHYESIEYVPPVQAGRQFGMEASAKGAIVLWTRGFGPHRSEARNPGGG
jgi:hypothetical protein